MLSNCITPTFKMPCLLTNYDTCILFSHFSWDKTFLPLLSPPFFVVEKPSNKDMNALFPSTYNSGSSLRLWLDVVYMSRTFNSSSAPSEMKCHSSHLTWLKLCPPDLQRKRSSPKVNKLQTLSVPELKTIHLPWRKRILVTAFRCRKLFHFIEVCKWWHVCACR